MLFKRGKKAQVTIFIIIAIVIVAMVVLFFVFRGDVQKQQIPAFVEPIENSFLFCLEENALTGITLLGLNGGNLEDIDFEPGSEYMPFSSHLNFVGNEIPYWFYVSGNNLPRENVPSIAEMETQLENYVEENLQGCAFEEFYGQDYDFEKGFADATVNIENNKIMLELDMDLSVSKGEDSFVVRDHSIEINSKLGSLYNDAVEIYEQEQQTFFLERYGIDDLRLYAPVDGVEIQCSPMVWNAEEVFSELKEAIEINTLALKSSGDKKDYFVVDNELNSDVRFIYSKGWPSIFEVAPNEGSSLVAEPVGNQPGLGVLGFCYVTYHYVYNLAYPVLIQVYEGDEIFQFPMAVIIRGNLPREGLKADISYAEEPYDVCKDKLSTVEMFVGDYNSNPVEADIFYECFGKRCDLGKTSQEGILLADIPQCINGFLDVQSLGFKDSKTLYSSVNEGSFSVFLEKEFEKEVFIYVEGRPYSGDAIVSFLSEGSSQVISYEGNNKIFLSEGSYGVQVQIFKDSSLNFASTTKEQCVEIPSSGVGGILGATKKECFEITVPKQIISTVLAGGGIGTNYFSENELQNSEKVILDVGALSVPTSIEELQNSYFSFESKSIGVSLR